jgi:hypothetical protein
MTAATNRPSKIGALRELLYALLQEHARDDLLPTSARFLFYELVTRGQYSKVATGARRADQDLIDALKRLRDEGRVRAVASEHRVRIASTNGQVGGFLHTEVAPLLQPGDTVGYLGDYDLAGGQIEANTRRVLERKIDGELNWTRIALTAQQVKQYDLPRIAKRDKRYGDGHPHEAVETEAIGQGLLIEILQVWLEARLPESLVHVQEREARQRARLEKILGGRQ